jgi:thiamine pyrophosphate-dependent acetolactate synthase large subunit-like protein
MLAITGMTYHDLIGTHYLQDINQDYLFQNVAAYNQRLLMETSIDPFSVLNALLILPHSHVIVL